MLDADKVDDTQMAHGVISIMTGCIFIVDLGLMVMQAKKERSG